MPLDFTSVAGNLFNVVGRIGAAVSNDLGFLGATAPASATTWGSSGGAIAALDTTIGNLLTQLTGATALKPLVNGLYTARDSFRTASQSWLVSYLQKLAADAVIAIVDAEVHLTPATKNIQGALAEVITQMISQGYYVAPPTVSASVASLVSPTTSGADGVCRCSVTNPAGVNFVSPFAEIIDVICTADSQPYGTAGRETFSVQGDAAAPSAFGYDWPAGSGASQTLQALDANSTASNILANGDFESFTSNVPDSWTSTVGTAGTDFAKETSAPYTGSAALKFIGTGSTVLTSFYQSLITNSAIKPKTVYAVNWWMKRSNASATGVFQVDLHDGSAVVNDDTATANSYARNISTQVTTSYAAYSTFFRTPSVLPAALRLRLGLTTTLNDTYNLFVDRLCLAPAAQAYAGGPYFNVFSGATKFIKGDKFPVTIANNWTVVSWASVFERLFGMRQLGLQLPVTGATAAIATSLIA